jgi:HD-GYP domain-containing protein (c-di-GMP phosphodiesterase class II)
MALANTTPTHVDTSASSPGIGVGCLKLGHESQGFVAILNSDGTISYANLEALRAFGVPLEAAVGSSIFSYVHSDDLQGVIAGHLMLCDAPNGEISKTIRFESRSSGEIREVDTQIFNRLHLSTLHGIIMNGLDVTRRNQFRTDLYRSLEFGADAVETVLEHYDSGSARHHREVTYVSTAIAEQLGMADDVIHGISCAAALHDIGEISIPEMSVPRKGADGSSSDDRLREHPRVGAGMLAGIGLAGPVAQMILQHHERIDGSGYPDGLMGPSILAGSQIVGLADTVAVMSGGMVKTQEVGLEAVLTRIESTRGHHFDNDIAGACLRLFREEGFHLRVVGVR